MDNPLIFQDPLVQNMTAMAALSFSIGYKVIPISFLTACLMIQLGLWSRMLWLMRPKSSLSQVPGPWFARWSRLWIASALASGRSHETWVEVNDKYGPVARIGPNSVVIDDPKIARRILSARSGYARGPWFDSLRIDPLIPNIVSERDIKKHTAIRAKIAPSFSGRSVAAMEPMMDELILGWLDTLRKNFMEPQRSFDIGQKMQYLSVDVISRLCFGKEIGCVKNDRDMHHILETVEVGNKACQYFSVFLELNTLFFGLSKIPMLRNMIFPTPTDTNGVGRMMGIVHEGLQGRGKDGKLEDTDDIISSLLRKGMSKEQIYSELVILLIGGSDTTSTSLQSTLLCIVTNPQIYSTLRSEIQRAVSRGQISIPIQESEAKQLPYLQACILEGLRKFPPVSQLRERVVPAGGDTLGGFHLPGGTYVGLNSWGLQLDKEVYGDDADLFRPERWLTEDAAQLEAMHLTHGLIFGHGSTKCLGTAMAMMEITKVTFELLRTFDITISNPHKPWSSICYGIFYQQDFNVCLSPASER